MLDQRTGAVLAQADVAGKTNEITRFQPLLAALDLTAAVVTAVMRYTPSANMPAGWPRTSTPATCSP
ncbi:hypothetical protein [Micromonospora chersina]|uniref:hypothetical protein n=1 Tax=Micromonospora chersina TaxID=47854 RepID=UPI003722F5E7